jgi:conjugal transfer pilus assembly protein TraF
MRVNLTSKIAISLLLVGSLVNPVAKPIANAQQSFAPRTDPQFYNRNKEGWFFYEKPISQPDELITEVPPVQPVPPQEDSVEQETTLSAQEAHSEDEVHPIPFSVAWLRREIPLALDRAIDEPTRENVLRWQLLQQAVLNKSEIFADVAEKVYQGDPVLDEGRRSPASGYGVKVAEQTAYNNKLDKLERLSAKAGLWYFFSNACPYCVRQSPVLKQFSENTGFRVLPISMDGQPDPGNAFSTYKTNTTQA